MYEKESNALAKGVGQIAKQTHRYARTGYSEAVGVHGARVALPLWQNRHKHALRHHMRRRTSPLGRARQEAQNMGFYVMCVETPHLAHANDVCVVVRCYQAACEAANHGVHMPAAHHDGIISNHR